MTVVRSPAVAGMFYPEDPDDLIRAVRGHLDAAEAGAGHRDGRRPKAVIVPHAGYIYSGSTAALAYAHVTHAEQVRRVVLLGPCHRVAVRGLALSGADYFETPLGRIPVARLEELPGTERRVVLDPEAHAAEHSLEVQLPFLQVVLGSFELVPLAVGRATPDEVADVIDALWGGPETLIVISSDLSHYLPYLQAQQVDAATLAQIRRLEVPLSHEQACGATPVNGMLVAAGRRGMTPELLGACNSGDTAGDRRRVVGYAAFAFPEEPHAER